MKKKTVLIISLTVLIMLFFGVQVSMLKKNKKSNMIVTTGLTRGQSDYFQEQMKEVGVQYGYIEKGNRYLKNGDIESAIKMFETAEKNAYSHSTKAEALFHLSNAYEKKGDFEKALEYTIVYRDEYVNDWARGPINERARYLEYAVAGEYELTIEHAQKAVEADVKINVDQKPREDYLERLNDLKSSKAYIESLKSR